MTELPPDAKPVRRWFRFRLATFLLFVVVVAVALSLIAGGLRQKRERHALLDQHAAPGYFKYRPYDPHSPVTKPKPDLTIQPTTQTIGLALRALGESEVAEVNLFLPPNDKRTDEIERASALFPEAVIHVYRMRGRRPIQTP